ncbi:2-isopropylmalate synthase [Ochrobactrum intermedium]|nr:2-isopropylmalate synthase [Brucella intermedia]
MAPERIYIYDTTLRDGQQTVTVRPQPRSVRGRTESKSSVRPQLRSVRGRTEVETGGCCAARMQGAE